MKTVHDSAIPTLQASKWLQQQMLLDEEELNQLFLELGDFTIYKVGVVAPLEKLEVPKQDFLGGYGDYIQKLKSGTVPNITDYRKLFSVVMTVSSDSLFAYRINENEYLVKIAQPVVQVQSHAMHFSKYDHKFRPMVFGPDSITWGLQFSYPQLYQDSATQAIHKVDDTESCPNTSLFRKIQRWQRKNTIPTPFLVENNKINVPMRLGKECLEWVNNHPQLREIGLKVAT